MSNKDLPVDEIHQSPGDNLCNAMFTLQLCA